VVPLVLVDLAVLEAAEPLEQTMLAMLEQQILVQVAAEPALMVQFHLEIQVKTEVMVETAQ
jgi:hypothetical protein